jgi:hypothetical protein
MVALPAQHGRQKVAYSVPFFWTNQVDLYFRYVGYAKEWDDIIVQGDLASENFIAYYVKNNKVYAAAGNNMEKEMAAIEVLMQLDRMPSPKELRGEINSKTSWIKVRDGELRQRPKIVVRFAVRV